MADEEEKPKKPRKLRPIVRPSKLRALVESLLTDFDMRDSTDEVQRETWQAFFDDLKRSDSRATQRLLGLLEDANPLWREEERERVAAVEWVVTGREAMVESLPEKPKLVLSVERHEAAMRLLEDPAHLWRIAQAIRGMGVAGEKESSLVLYLNGTSRLLDHPIGTTVKADSAAGKNYLLAAVSALFPEEAIVDATRLSPKALYYMQPDALKHKWLQVVEHKGKGDAAESVRWLLSEGKLINETVQKNPETGAMETTRKVVEGPTAMTTTTTEAQLAEDDETRNLSVHLDESADQTQAILRTQASMYDGFRPLTEDERTVWRDAQRILEEQANRPHDGVRESIIPYAQFLADDFPTDEIRARRDFPRLLEAINGIAFLHQFQRERTRDGRIVATPADYYYARLLFEDFLERSMKGLPPETEKILNAAKEHFPPRLITKGVDEEGHTEAPEFTRGKLAEKIGRSEHWVRKWVEPLHHTYFRVLEGGQGKPYRYQLADGPETGLALPAWDEIEELGTSTASPELRPDGGRSFPLRENVQDCQTSPGSPTVHICVFDPTDESPTCPKCGGHTPGEVGEVGSGIKGAMEETTSPGGAGEPRAKSGEDPPRGSP